MIVNSGGVMNMHQQPKYKRVKKWHYVGIVIIGLVGAGGYIGWSTYQSYQTHRIYLTGESVAMSDLTIQITKAEFKPVNVPLDKESIAKYGSLNTQENCETQSRIKTWSGRDDKWYQDGPSDYNICVRRNSSRDAINTYTKHNNQFVVDYTITARNTVDTSQLHIALIPDSGRKLDEQVDALNANQFFPGGAQHKNSTMMTIGAPGPTYTPEYSLPYKPYHVSNIGGEMHQGIKRSGYAYTDVRTSEHTVDMKITYKNEARIIRVMRS